MTSKGPARCHLFTLGHSTRTIEEFRDCLKGHAISDIVDVRGHPRSAHNPHFDRTGLAPELEAAGIGYHWLGRELGGFRKAGYRTHMTTPLFLAGMARVLTLADDPGPGQELDHNRNHDHNQNHNHDHNHDYNQNHNHNHDNPTPNNGRNVALMCAEFKWFRCHRRYIADWLVAKGFRVTHILDTEQTIEHAEGLMGEAGVWCDRRAKAMASGKR